LCGLFDDPDTLDAKATSPVRISPCQWRQPREVTLTRRVCALDRHLGANVNSVREVLMVQSVVLSRQECARQAYDSSRRHEPGRVPWQLPIYLLNPLQALAHWPFADTEVPTI